MENSLKAVRPIILVFLCFYLVPVSLSAQTDCPCCDKNHRAFDFWEGNWVVKDTLGNVIGENSISKIEDGCVLQENWKGNTGSTGTSMNYYNRIDSTWNQVWVDNRGGVLKLKGNKDSSSMVLKSDVIQGQQSAYFNRISWTPNKDGTVTQFWEICDPEGKQLQIAFKGIYHRKEE